MESKNRLMLVMSLAVTFCCCATNNRSASVSSRSPESTQKQITSMVTGTTGAQALDGGLKILKKGGNAMDAALSTSLSQIALAGGSWVSYAGIMNLVYYEAKSGKVYDMNASFNTVKNENDPLSIPGGVSLDFSKKSAPTNGRAVLVPGYMAGVEAASKRFGTLPFTDIFESAIAIAENGFLWSSGLTYQYEFRKEILSRLPSTKAVFTKKDGSTIKEGDLFMQPALAKTLKNVVKYGSQYMYTGEWASKFVNAVQLEGGKLTMNDLKDYQVLWNEPLKGSYNGHDVYVHGFPAIGGVNTIEALNLLEAAKLGKQETFAENPQALKELSDILRIGDIAPYLEGILKAVPNLDFTLTGRLKKENAIILYELIKQGYFSGIAPKTDNTPRHSDAIVAIDKWGNICAMTHTINAVSWGATGIFVDGISIPDPASFQQNDVAKAGAGNRLPDPTNPGIVLKNGVPVLGFASIGAGLHARTIGSLLSVLDYKFTPQETVDGPGLGALTFNADGSMPRTVDTTEFTSAVLKRAHELGEERFVHDPVRAGYWVGISRDSLGNLNGSTIKKLNLGGRAVGY
jgi:gamma-glutamyltranspeptidase/glutathione hydrolase